MFALPWGWTSLRRTGVIGARPRGRAKGYFTADNGSRSRVSGWPVDGTWILAQRDRATADGQGRFIESFLYEVKTGRVQAANVRDHVLTQRAGALPATLSTTEVLNRLSGCRRAISAGSTPLLLRTTRGSSGPRASTSEDERLADPGAYGTTIAFKSRPPANIVGDRVGPAVHLDSAAVRAVELVLPRLEP
jgi:hypothetical protein